MGVPFLCGIYVGAALGQVFLWKSWIEPIRALVLITLIGAFRMIGVQIDGGVVFATALTSDSKGRGCSTN